MKVALHITLTVFSGFSLAGLLSGCALPMKEDIARSTTEFNLIAEKAGNEMLLLNIIRASKRRPMYFTSIDKLTGKKTFEYGTGGVSIPFGQIGKGANTSYSIAPSAGYMNSPVFEVTALNTKKFTNGIMTPVTMKTVEYYLNLEWPSEILMHLFIRRIVIPDPNAPKGYEVYLNDPGEPINFSEFQMLIRDYQWKIKQTAGGTKIGEVDANDTSQLKNLIEAHKAGLTLTPVKDNNKEQGKDKNKENNKMELYSSQAKYVLLRCDKNGGNIVEIDEKDISLRSPQAMLYYLGEILRVEIRSENKGKMKPDVPMISAGHGECEGTKSWLFYARKATDEDVAPCVSVDYERTKYIIPGFPESNRGCCTDRSMQVLSLVSQLIGLQKESEIPATGVIPIISR